MMIYYAISVTYNLYRLVLITALPHRRRCIYILFREAQAKRKCERYEVASKKDRETFIYIYFFYSLLPFGNIFI